MGPISCAIVVEVPSHHGDLCMIRRAMGSLITSRACRKEPWCARRCWSN
jgi:hypothetical protein